MLGRPSERPSLYARFGAWLVAFWARYSPWVRNEHDAAISTACAEGGLPSIKLLLHVYPVFENRRVEDAYQRYLQNQTAQGFATLVGIGSLMFLLYLEDDATNPLRQNMMLRLVLRSMNVFVLLALAIVYRNRLRLAPRVVMWSRCAGFCAVSVLIHARLYYETLDVTYVRGVGIWSVALKAVAACFDTGLLRIFLFNCVDNASNMTINQLRSGTAESPIRW
jgi:membrane-associated HD superfamily phosphohydrolase